MLSCFVYNKFYFNQLSHRKTTNGKIQPPFMTFNVGNVIAENVDKSGISLLSRSLIPINEVFDKQNQFVKLWTKVQNGVKVTFKKHTDNFNIGCYLSVHHSINSQIID